MKPPCCYVSKPVFPRSGEVFIAVSAGDYRDGGFSTFFGEFFIFASKKDGNLIGRRVYVHQHLTRGGMGEVFELAKTRAIAELSDEVAKRLGDEKSILLDDGISVEETD